MRSSSYIFPKTFLNIYVLFLSLSVPDFWKMAAEANIFDNIVSTVSTVSTGVNNAVDKVKNTAQDVVQGASNAIDKVKSVGEDVIENVRNTTEKLTDIAVDDKEVVFKYYNKDHPAGEAFNIQEFNEGKLKGWRQNAPLKVITHGWTNSDQSESVVLIKDAYLKKHDFNLITVDWSGPANDDNYSIPASKTKGVGQIIARLINDLVKKTLVTWENVHMIGHSLGGHVVGVAGGHTEGKVARLSALDVAGPIFNEIDRPDLRVLDSTDAVFVDVTHTAGGEIGFGPDSSRGHVDFYPNGGTHPQPGCPKTRGLSCSHGRAFHYFAESIINPNAFIGKQCDNWMAFRDGDCDNNASVVMGDPTPNTAKGNYYLATNNQPPYGRG